MRQAHDSPRGMTHHGAQAGPLSEPRVNENQYRQALRNATALARRAVPLGTVASPLVGQWTRLVRRLEHAVEAWEHVAETAVFCATTVEAIHNRVLLIGVKNSVQLYDLNRRAQRYSAALRRILPGVDRVRFVLQAQSSARDAAPER